MVEFLQKWNIKKTMDLSKKIDINNVQNDRSNPTVKSFLDLIGKCELDSDRKDAIEEAEENRGLKDQFFAPLAKGRKLKRFKDSFLLQLSRRYTEEGNDIPKPFANSRNDQKTMGEVAEAIQEREYSFSYFFKTISKIFNSEKTDGMAFLHFGVLNGKVNLQRRELAKVWFDSNATEFNEPPESDDAPKWAVIAFDYSYKEAVKLANKMSGGSWEGRLLPGAPITSDSKYKNVTDKWKDGGDTKDDTVTFHLAYHLIEDKFCVYAGAAAGLIVQPEKIKFRPKDIRGERRPRLPLVAFEFSGEKKGAFPLSLYGAAKDITESYRDLLDRAFQHFKMQINPFIFLFSDAGSSIIQQMKGATQLQELGSPPIILAPGAEKTRMESIQPNSNALDMLLNYKGLAVNELAERLGLNISKGENVKQPFSTFERRNQFENLAIANHNNINKSAFAMCADYVVDMHVLYNVGSDKEKVTITFEGEGGESLTKQINYPIAVKMIKEWDGNFSVDTNVKIPINSEEKFETMGKINEIVTADSASGIVRTQEQADLKTSMVWEMIKRADLEEQWPKKTIIDFYNSLIPLPPAEGTPNVGNTLTTPTTESIQPVEKPLPNLA